MELTLVTMIVEKSTLFKTTLNRVVKMVFDLSKYANTSLRSRIQSIRRSAPSRCDAIIVQPFDTRTEKDEILRKELMVPGKRWVAVGKVHTIIMYPLMSGLGIIASECHLDHNGITVVNDDFKLRNNMFVIYDQTTKCIQRDKFDIDLRGLQLKMWNKTKVVFENTRTTDLILELKDVQTFERVECTTSFCNKFLVKVECYDCGAQVAKWISSYLEKPNLRLGYTITESKKSETIWQTLHKLYNHCTDERNIMMPYLTVPPCTFLSMPLFNHLNMSIDYPLYYHHFQHNIVISLNRDCPLEMEKWEWIKIGRVIFRNIKPWPGSAIDVNLKTTPVELKMRFMLIHGELYQSGKVELDDTVYILKGAPPVSNKDHEQGYNE